MTSAFTLEPRPFETDFWSRPVCRLALTPGVSATQLATEIGQLLESSENDVIETNLDLSDILLANVLTDHGFRLVDSRITFVSRVATGDPEFAYPSEHPDIEIRMFDPDDLDRVLELTHENLTDNRAFVSRYKDESVFGVGSARRWFDAWMNDMVRSSQAHTAVAVVDGQVKGFFTYENRGPFAESEPLYKGVLAAVDPAFRGEKLHLILQSYLFNRFSDQAFWIENATQLSNYAVIKNHVRSNRRLRNCELTYLRATAHEH
jgi:hypothetical protein